MNDARRKPRGGPGSYVSPSQHRRALYKPIPSSYLNLERSRFCSIEEICSPCSARFLRNANHCPVCSVTPSRHNCSLLSRQEFIAIAPRSGPKDASSVLAVKMPRLAGAASLRGGVCFLDGTCLKLCDTENELRPRDEAT
jgi:hypothetical protein